MRQSNWRLVAVALAAGILAGVQVGIVPPAFSAIRSDLSLSMVEVAWVASIFNLAGAAIGIAGGALADRAGPRRATGLSLLALAAGAIVGALATSGVLLIFSRLLAGIGLLGVAVSAPGIIVGATRQQDHGLALGIWSCYLPAGFALGLVLTAPQVQQIGWRSVWLLDGLALLLFTAAFVWLTRDIDSQPARNKRHWLRGAVEVGRRPGPWLLGACFAAYTVQWFALTTWLPTLLGETLGLGPVAASMVTAAVVLSNLIGNFSGAWLLHRAVPRWWLLIPAYVVMMLCAFLVFRLPQEAATIKLMAAFLFSAAGGAIPAALLGAASHYAGKPQQVSTVNGFIIQGSYIGTLAGAPLLAFTVQQLDGWNDAWVISLCGGLTGILLALALRATESTHSGARSKEFGEKDVRR